MGFFDSVMDMAQTGIKNLGEKVDRIQDFKYKYSRCSDEELIRNYKSFSGEEKMAVGLLLKERGYGK